MNLIKIFSILPQSTNKVGTFIGRPRTKWICNRYKKAFYNTEMTPPDGTMEVHLPLQFGISQFLPITLTHDKSLQVYIFLHCQYMAILLTNSKESYLYVDSKCGQLKNACRGMESTLQHRN